MHYAVDKDGIAQDGINNAIVPDDEVAEFDRGRLRFRRDGVATGKFTQSGDCLLDQVERLIGCGRGIKTARKS